MIAAYYKRLTSPDQVFYLFPAFSRFVSHHLGSLHFLSQEVRRAAAKEWCLWEMGTSKLIPDSAYIDKVNQICRLPPNFQFLARMLRNGTKTARPPIIWITEQPLN